MQLVALAYMSKLSVISYPFEVEDRVGLTVHCKNIRISTHILWRVFRTFNGFIIPWIFAWQTYTEPVPLKYGKLAGQNIRE